MQVVWTLKGFNRKHGGKLTKQCATLIEEWIDTWEALEWDAGVPEEPDPSVSEAVPHRKRPSSSSQQQQQQRAARQKKVIRGLPRFHPVLKLFLICIPN